MVFDLRDDIKNRDDAWVFYECIKLVAKTVWWKDKSFKSKIRKGKFEYIQPGFGSISDKTYDNLHPAVKKYFSEIKIWDKNWRPLYKSYECSVPSYYFVTKIKPRWITRYKEFDSVIEKQIDEKEDYLRSEKFWAILGWYGTAPKSYCKGYNRSDRRNTKQTNYRNIMNGGDNFDGHEYRYAHRHSASWDYW